MKNFLLILAFFVTISISAQYTISGTFTPAKDYTWLIAYHLKPGTQIYVADTAIKDGKFEMKIPENSPSGIYRLVYAVPQEEFNFDIIYTGKEDLKLTFESNAGVAFENSKENILFNTYFKEIQSAERHLISFYSNGSKDFDEYRKITQNYMAIQHSFMERSDGLMVQEFIRANRPYIPPKYETIHQYVKNRKEKYFNVLDLSNPLLQASGFLTDKLGNYVFTALPLKQMSDEETQNAMQENLRTIVEKLDDVSNSYQFSTLYSIWTQASASAFYNFSDTIYNSYLKTKASTPEHQRILSEIELQNRLRLGAIAPEISIKVIAIGLEDDDDNWKLESAKLKGFEHAIALGKWDSEYADLYGIQATPTYFILNEEKRIIAKPANDKGVIEFLEKI